jgi:transcriptional regulator GlxA family with amidase domain
MVPKKKIGFIGFDGVTAVDLVVPAEAFAAAETTDQDGRLCACYEVFTIGLSNQPFVAESGMIFKPQKTLQDAPILDTLIIPGGHGLRRPDTSRAVSAFIKARAGRTRRIVAVCTGIYGLAETGLLSGRRVTTHWRFARDVARRYPTLILDDNAIFLKDGAFYTSAGAMAGIDLSLFLIEEDFGPQAALLVARELVVYVKRSGGQEQYSEPLRFQTEAVDRFAELATWMVSNLDQNLSVEVLASRACLCPRQFTRRFKRIFGSPPADFVEKLRLDEARRRLVSANNSVENVGVSVGYKSPDTFRRAFQRRLGINPTVYQRRFGVGASFDERD